MLTASQELVGRLLCVETSSRVYFSLTSLHGTIIALGICKCPAMMPSDDAQGDDPQGTIIALDSYDCTLPKLRLTRPEVVLFVYVMTSRPHWRTRTNTIRVFK